MHTPLLRPRVLPAAITTPAGATRCPQKNCPKPLLTSDSFVFFRTETYFPALIAAWAAARRAIGTRKGLQET